MQKERKTINLETNLLKHVETINLFQQYKWERMDSFKPQAMLGFSSLYKFLRFLRRIEGFTLLDKARSSGIRKSRIWNSKISNLEFENRKVSA